jgi:hypothetical protein
MSTEAKTSKRRSGGNAKHPHTEGNRHPTHSEEKVERKHQANPETEGFRGAIAEAGRLAAYAAEAIVPNTARNRQAEVAKVRRNLACDAVAEIIGSGKHRLPDRARTHVEHASRKDGIELS